MVKEIGGAGRTLSSKNLEQLRSRSGPQFPSVVDLNTTKLNELSKLPMMNSSLANKILKFRKNHKISTPQDLFHAGLLNIDQLRSLNSVSHGSLSLKPLLKSIEATSSRLYVDEVFTLKCSWSHSQSSVPKIISITVQYPTGTSHELHKRLTSKHVKAGKIEVRGFVPRESGELMVHATLRDSIGGVSNQNAMFGVFTRNPVQMFVTPSFTTQSGSVGAPKYNFDEDRWYCYVDVRWVNGESRSVNLGRRVDVRASDAGTGTVANFNFNLSNDIVIPAFSTVYGTLYTYHGSGGIFDEFQAKGDLTFQYSMSGSGFTPTRSVVWRVMRAIGYNIIRVGDFTSAERNEYQYAAENIASGIFRSRDMSVFGTELYRIEGTTEMDADKQRWRFIDNDDEFDAMASKYSVDNWFMDVFMVEGYFGGFGASYVDAPFNKNGDRSGIVVGRDSDTVNLGQTFAHEAGHHLGLEHADDDDGCDDTDPSSANISDNFIFSASRRDSDVISPCQMNKMRRHKFVRSMTP